MITALGIDPIQKKIIYYDKEMEDHLLGADCVLGSVGGGGYSLRAL